MKLRSKLRELINYELIVVLLLLSRLMVVLIRELKRGKVEREREIGSRERRSEEA